MRFSAVSAAILAFATSVVAQTAGFDPITAPADGELVAAGSTYTIKWQPGDVKGQIKISLIGGATQGTQIPLGTIAQGVENQKGSYSWTVDSTLGKDAVYGLRIDLEGAPTETFQWGFPFKIKAAEGGASTATGSGYKTEGQPTVTVSLTHGVSSATKAASSTAAPAVSTTSVPATYSTVVPPTGGNATVTKSHGTDGSSTTTLATVPSPKPSGSATTSSTIPVSTNGAARMAAGSVVAAGFVAALFL